MGKRLNSIRIPVNFGSPADIATSITQTKIGDPIIYLPENGVSTPVTCSSVALYVAIQDTSTATGGTLSQFTASIQLSGSATSSVFAPFAGTLANTAENWGGLIGPIDFTDYFTGSFGTTYTAKTASVSVAASVNTGTGTAVRGVYGYIDLTYEFDDTTSRRINTVCVPYESLTTGLNTTPTTHCRLPQLTGTGGWLNGYSNLTIRNRWLEIKGNVNNNNTTTDQQVTYSFDSGANSFLPIRESGLGSDTWQLYQIDASSLDTTVTHSFQLSVGTTNRYYNTVVNEWITYEYDVTGNTEALNYIEIPITFPNQFSNVYSERWTGVVNIPEPGPITIRKCAAEMKYVTTTTATMQIKAGNLPIASYRAYAATGNVVAGQMNFQHGLDSGSAIGNAYTWSRGDNTVTLDMYRSAGASSYLSGIFKLLYSSGISSGSIDDHTSVRSEILRPMNFTSQTDTTSTGFFKIPESNYYIQGGALNIPAWPTTAGSLDTAMMTIDASNSVGTNNRGFYNLGFLTNTADNELSYVERSYDFYPYIKKYPRDQNTNLIPITSSRVYRYVFNVGSKFGSMLSIPYHTITHKVSGSISNSSGGTVSLELVDLTSNTIFDTGSRVGNGSYDFTVYDDTKQYQVIAYESSTYKGVSKQGTPANDFDISLAAAAGGGEFFF